MDSTLCVHVRAKAPREASQQVTHVRRSIKLVKFYKETDPAREESKPLQSVPAAFPGMPCHEMAGNAMPCEAVACHATPRPAVSLNRTHTDLRTPVARHGMPCHEMASDAMPCGPCHAMRSHALRCHETGRT